MKYVIRVVALPFVIALSVISATYNITRMGCLFIRYGGEFILKHPTLLDDIAEIKQILKDLKHEEV